MATTELDAGDASPSVLAAWTAARTWDWTCAHVAIRLRMSVLTGRRVGPVACAGPANGAGQAW